jgi:DNA topoisomerase-2
MMNGVLSFSVADVARSIPGFDGFKDVQRKIIYTAFKSWGAKIRTGKCEKMKVARFAPLVSAKTEYEHGELSISGAITAMAQNFTGSNNLPLFFPDGQFGSRTKNGKDAASGRYIFTRPDWPMALIFRQEDECLLTQRVDEGQEFEYNRYKPIVPVVLFNGQLGIATGFSTYIPPYNPIDICVWLALRLRQQLTNKCESRLKPWFRDFVGSVHIKERKPKTPKQETVIFNFADIQIDENEEEEEDDDEQETELHDDYGDSEIMEADHVEFGIERGTRRRQANTSSYSMVTLGSFTEISKDDGKSTIKITELPIGRSIHVYKDWLDEMVKTKVISDYENHSKANSPSFIIKGYTKKPTHKNLKLFRSFGISNMVLLDEQGKPKYYATVIDILNTYYDQRLKDYEARKNLQVQNMREAIKIVDYKIILIQAIVDGRLIVIKRPKAEIYANMDQLGVPHEYLDKVNLRNLTQEDVAELMAHRDKLYAELQNYMKINHVTIWEEELKEFVGQYLKRFPDEIHRMTDPGLTYTCLAKFANEADPSCVPNYDYEEIVDSPVETPNTAKTVQPTTTFNFTMQPTIPIAPFSSAPFTAAPFAIQPAIQPSSSTMPFSFA